MTHSPANASSNSTRTAEGVSACRSDSHSEVRSRSYGWPSLRATLGVRLRLWLFPLLLLLLLQLPPRLVALFPLLFLLLLQQSPLLVALLPILFLLLFQSLPVCLLR